MSMLSTYRQEKWVRGLVCRIEAHNKGKSWREQIEVPTIGTYDGEPFVILESWEQARKLATLAGVKSRDDDYPDIDNRVETGFSDEYSTCCDCNKIIRISPDSYSWQPDFIATDDGYVCSECMESDPDSIIDEVKNTRTPLPRTIDPGEHGWSRLNGESCESGWFPGQTDDPETFASVLGKHGIDYLFTIDEPSQFYTKWSVWVPDEQLSESREAI